MTTLFDQWGIHPHHFWLRGQQPGNPVVFDEKTSTWNVYGFDAVQEILAHPKTFSSGTADLLAVEVDPEVMEGNILQMDPPGHRQLRNLVSSAFTPKVVADLEPKIVKLTHELLDKVQGQDRIELVGDLAYPLPVIVIAELLGVPASDRDLFRGWAERMMETSIELLRAERAEEQERALKEQLESIGKLRDYLRVHVLERRRQPREDLLTKLVEATVDGERLSDNEVVNFAYILLVAGHITTTLLIGNTVLCLDAHPEEDRLLRADRSRIPGVLEETLRFLTPFSLSLRATTEEVELAGQRIPSKTMVHVWLSAANRDPRHFDRPDVFDPSRASNSHLGFGRGIHHCLGAPLARMEGRIVLDILLDRFPALRTDPALPPTFMQADHMTGARTLPLLTRV
ncbi:cytochrome P450 [Streptomyces venezuelae]|uniref:Cytochrome P450 n=1 Tax=Streptomyces venezuelae TaxID=54571 RepID=A0A5P2D1H3_STRVZ|nr:cytochrome P450 [Streptomyces venezuelae]QES47201.1 cytochrome P450 [Streptomyces venezuelae]